MFKILTIHKNKAGIAQKGEYIISLIEAFLSGDKKSAHAYNGQSD